MTNNGREALRGVEVETFDLLAEVYTSEQWWEELLAAPRERAAAKGNRDFAQHVSGREAVRGEEVEAVDLIAEVLTSQRWAHLLKATLEHAAFKGNRGLAQKLLRAGAEIGDALCAAVRGGRVDIVNDLLDGGASLAAENAYGRTPLHVATAFGEIEMMELLLLNGADTNALDREGKTPLMDAAANSWRNTVEVVNVLVGNGANIEARAEDGETALHEAARELNCDAAMALLKHGADINVRDKWNHTPLRTAACIAGDRRASEMVGLLLRAGADETIADEFGGTAASAVGAYNDGPLPDNYSDYEDLLQSQEEASEDLKAVRRLLASAPAEKAWRRRGYLVLCRAHPDKMQQGEESSSGHDGMARRTRRGTVPARAAGSGGDGAAGGGVIVGDKAGGDWADVVARVLSLQEEGLFRKIVGYL